MMLRQGPCVILILEPTFNHFEAEKREKHRAPASWRTSVATAGTTGPVNHCRHHREENGYEPGKLRFHHYEFGFKQKKYGYQMLRATLYCIKALKYMKYEYHNGNRT